MRTTISNRVDPIPTFLKSITVWFALIFSLQISIPVFNSGLPIFMFTNFQILLFKCLNDASYFYCCTYNISFVYLFWGYAITTTLLTHT